METGLINNDRWRREKILTDSLEDLLREIKDIKTRVINSDMKNISRGLEQSEVEVLIEKVKYLSLSEQKFAKANAVLSSLDFAQRVRRYEDIHEAHRQTFQWIFGGQRTSDTAQERRFIDWLERNDGVFWVSGRPGSGKSTLMKFIYNHSITQSTLSRWASPKKVVIANHFFWGAGLPIQRSQEGLLRSLLYSLLSQISEVMNSCSGEQW